MTLIRFRPKSTRDTTVDQWEKEFHVSFIMYSAETLVSRRPPEEYKGTSVFAAIAAYHSGCPDPAAWKLDRETIELTAQLKDGTRKVVTTRILDATKEELMNNYLEDLNSAKYVEIEYELRQY